MGNRKIFNVRLYLAFILFLGVSLTFGIRSVKATSSIATISSSVYTITDDGLGNGKISNVLDNTSTVDFLANITKDQAGETFDTFGLIEPVNPDGLSTLNVTAEDGVTSIFYIIDGTPTATDVSISGNCNVGQTLTGSYTYTDVENDPEGVPTFKWYRGKNVITGQTSATYVVQPEDEGQMIYFSVLVQAQIGTTYGLEKKSFGVLIDLAPVASSVSVAGNPVVGQTLTGSYTYSNSYRTWTHVGVPYISAGSAIYTSFNISPDGTLYVAYSGLVKKFNGSTWVDVGTTIYDTTVNGYQYITFSPDGTPYVSFGRDFAEGGNLTVKKFNGSSWVDVGNTYFSDGSVDGHYSYLDFDTLGSPYVSYIDASHSNKITVKKFNGSTWVDVGSPSFSDTNVASNTLSFDIGPDDIPYISYKDASNSLAIKKFNGSTWVDVGTQNFATGIFFTSIKVNSQGVPYISYANDSLTVKKFNGNNWVDVGTPDFSDGYPVNLRMDIDASDNVWVGYEDFSNGRNGDFQIEARFIVKEYVVGASDWVNVGTPSIRSNGSDQMFFNYNDIDNTPYFGLDDGMDNWRASVKKLINNTDAEGTTTFQWYRDGSLISGQTSTTYTIQNQDAGHSIYFKVTPVALTGTLIGEAVSSSGLSIPSNHSIPIIHVFPSPVDGNAELAVLINGSFLSSTEVISPILNLSFNANKNTIKGYAISTSPDFSGLGILPYSSDVTFDLKKEGIYNLYIRFYSTTGDVSKLIEKKIVYKKSNSSDINSKFNRNLRVGDRGLDVRELQVYLNNHGYPLISEGLGSLNNETDLFGILTKKAVVKFQQYNKIKGTGFFGPITRSKILENISSIPGMEMKN